MPDDTVLHDTERLGEKAKQARAIAEKRKEGDTKRLLTALADNFERLAELAKTKEAALSDKPPSPVAEANQG